MRKMLVAFCLLVANLFLMNNGAQAGAPAFVANIFDSIGGTTTIDSGGAMHSQARSIYSLGGGMTTFKGKRVSLLAADPPTFSAGCSGISWHFGGFAFISVDEIRQLVEAVAQASLGVAVDLAMHVLCPQCYSVMTKLRDISNAMRNAAFDACRISNHFKATLQSKGILPTESDSTDCSTASAERAESDTFFGALLDPCKSSADVQNKLSEIGDDVLNFFSLGNAGIQAAGKKTPSKDVLDKFGNTTYDTLEKLGYKDGFVKDFMLSFTGMAIVYPVPDYNCRGAFEHLKGTAETDAKAAETVNTILDFQPDTNIVKSSSSTSAPTPPDAPTNSPSRNPTDSEKRITTCYAPPLLSGMQEVAIKLICGFDPTRDMITFQKRFHANIQQLNDSSLGALCSTQNLAKALIQGPVPQLSTATKASTDPHIYWCEKEPSSECVKPKLRTMSEALSKTLNTSGGSAQTARYTGLAWMLLDALYSGVDAIQNNQPLPIETVKILNSSGYPLYRLLNLAAVYPAQADELLQSYGSTIAIHYAVDTLEKMMMPGAQPTISLKGTKSGIDRSEVLDLRSHIMNMLHDASPLRDQTMRRLSEKRALVDNILQINRALQAEVISQGLLGNNDLAVNLKKQQTK